MKKLDLTVNGEKHSISVDPQTPLLYVLRNELTLSGPRLGCGMAQCGACAVLVDGREVRSCVTPVAAVEGSAIHTVEGLAGLWAERGNAGASEATESLHPVQQAWIDEQVPQCGFCQSGMMIAATDLLSHNPEPTTEEIMDAFTNTPPSPHLCRCGTYAAIIDAVHRAASSMKRRRGRNS